MKEERKLLAGWIHDSFAPSQRALYPMNARTYMQFANAMDSNS